MARPRAGLSGLQGPPNNHVGRIRAVYTGDYAGQESDETEITVPRLRVAAPTLIEGFVQGAGGLRDRFRPSENLGSVVPHARILSRAAGGAPLHFRKGALVGPSWPSTGAGTLCVRVDFLTRVFASSSRNLRVGPRSWTHRCRVIFAPKLGVFTRVKRLSKATSRHLLG